MGFGKQNTAALAGRLERVSGSTSASTVAIKRKTVEPDFSKVKRYNPLSETEEERVLRMRAKTVNFTCTIFARLVIIASASYFAYDAYITSNGLNWRPILGVFLLFAELGRVLTKMMTPGTK